MGITVMSSSTFAAKEASIVESLAMPEATDVEFEPPRLADKLVQLPDLSDKKVLSASSATKA